MDIFFAKETDFNKITFQQLKNAQFALDKIPRKVLGYKTVTHFSKIQLFASKF